MSYCFYVKLRVGSVGMNIDTYVACYAGDGGVALGKTNAEVPLVNSIDPHFLEGGMGRHQRDKRSEESNKREHSENLKVIKTKGALISLTTKLTCSYTRSHSEISFCLARQYPQASVFLPLGKIASFLYRYFL